MNPTARLSKGMLTAGALGFCAAALLGWRVERQSSHREELPGPSTPQRERSADMSAAGSSLIPQKATQALATIRGAGSAAARQRATMDLVDSLSTAELLEWLRGGWFSIRGGGELMVFTGFAKERLATEDPEGLIRYYDSRFSDEAGKVLIYWARRDPAAVIDYFNRTGMTAVESEPLAEMAKDRPAVALAGLRHLIAQADSESQTTSSYPLLLALTASSGDELRTMLPDLPPTWKTSLEIALAERHLTASFHEGIRDLWNQPDGLEWFRKIAGNNGDMGTALLREAADLPADWRDQLAEVHVINMDNATQWLEADLKSLGFSDEASTDLKRSALDELILKDARLAITLSPQVAMNPEERASFISSAFSRLGGEPGERQQIIDSLPSEEERAAARKAETPEVISDYASPNISPQRWLETLGDGEGERPEIGQTLEMLRKMDRSELTGLANVFQTLPDDRKSVAASLLANFSGSDTISGPLQGQAIQYLLAHPEAELRVIDLQSRPEILSSTYAVKLSEADPAAAVSWVAALPEGGVKLWTMKNLAVGWADYDPPAVEAWLKTLPPTAQQPVRNFMAERQK